MTQPSTRRHVALATFVLVAMTAAACGHSSPVAPDAAASNNDAAATASAALAIKPKADPPTERFSLSDGAFTIEGRKGGEIHGTYLGETVVLNGVPVTTLQLTVNGGNGVFAGASGQLEGRGTGIFTGEGAFALEVSGFVSTDEKKNAKFNAELAGSFEASCVDTHVIVSVTTSPGVEPPLHHQVGNAGCY